MSTGAEAQPRVKIAVVDDEKLILQVFSSLMRQFHYDADFFSSSLRAFETIAANPGKYKLVISDIRMPEMDGITFAKKIRSLFPDLPIVFMTGDMSAELKEQAQAMGNIVFLEKPFPLEAVLKEVIPRFLGQGRQA